MTAVLDLDERGGRIAWGLIAAAAILLIFAPVVALPFAVAGLFVAYVNRTQTALIAAAATLIMTIIMLAFRGPGAFFFENAGRAV